MSSPAPAPFGVAPQRTPVEFDVSTGGLRIGPYERRIEDPAEPSQVYSAYLALLYAVRGARPGERLALREADLDALLLIVGDDPETIEERLVGLMGCTAEEASILGRLLLRHRKATATLGIAAGITLGAAGLVSWAGGDPAAPAEVVQSANAAPVEAPAPISGTTQTAESTVVGPVAPAPAPVLVGPVASAVVQPPTTAVVVAAPEPVAPAPVPPAVVAPVPAPAAAAPAPAPVVVAPAPAVPVAAAPDPEVQAPAPVAVEVVETDPAYALPTYAVPVMDAPPPPVAIELPDSAIGEPAVLDGPVEQIGGVVDSGEVLPVEPLEPVEPVGIGPVAEPALEPAPLDAPVEISGTAGG